VVQELPRFAARDQMDRLRFPPHRGGRAIHPACWVLSRIGCERYLKAQLDDINKLANHMADKGFF